LEDPEYLTQCAKRIERAVNLAALLGRRQEHFDKVISHVESVLDAPNDMQKSLTLVFRLLLRSKRNKRSKDSEGDLSLRVVE
jgi:hypothetical protein